MSRPTITIACLIALAASSIVAETPAKSSTNSDWSAFHRGGELRGEAAPDAVAPPPMNLRWTYYTDDKEPAAIEGGAAIVGGVAYVGDSAGKLHAVDLATGKRKWVYAPENANGFSST